MLALTYIMKPMVTILTLISPDCVPYRIIQMKKTLFRNVI